MISLLDISVLIPLVDVKHENHDVAVEWFLQNRVEGWATCPITENGVIRIVGSPTYPNSAGLMQAVESVRALLRMPGHVFWADDVSLLHRGRFDLGRAQTSMETTDIYLLALAVSHGGRFATFDRRVAVDAVLGGSASIHILKNASS